ncbi:MAG: SIR2 family protein [Burkholderiales bacterium]|nr:SIR2 family protein [Burkholderiales bacterium]
MELDRDTAESELYVSAIRKALVDGNAAVMVGAGFSRNAEGGAALATWRMLAEQLAQALHVGSDQVDFPATSVVTLAEQYSRVFSTAGLEAFLKRMVPDDRVAPGEAHFSLLRLRWAEIFTTNYDTLIERAAERIFDKAHFTVCCREDIPQSKILGRRRIVKLHGSFPSRRPFIFTEEDYRTYPERFAPFVNLVRQSLLENVFCLFGFSGDDPNFLHWIGWVRDVLDRHALPIYLFLDRSPSLGQRKLLEARGVIPVVLPTAASGDPKDFSGRYLELFRLLDEPRQESIMEWPKFAWKDGAYTYDDDQSANFESLKLQLPRLASKRSSYPGWIVAPRKVRRTFAMHVRQQPHWSNARWLVDRLSGEGDASVIGILGLYVWQQVVLRPLEDALALIAIRVIRQYADFRIETLRSTELGFLSSINIIDQAAFQREWTRLGFSVARWARQSLREVEFRELVALLRRYAPSDGKLEDSIRYEEILLQMYRGERGEAKAALQAWRIKSADPYMLVRKSGLSAELGLGENALSVCKEAIQILRDSQRLLPGDPLLESEEAWACVIADRVQTGMQYLAWPYVRGYANDREIEGLDNRLEMLATKGYAAIRELEEVSSALNAEAQPAFAVKYRFSGFDLGRIETSQRFGVTSELQSKIEAAFEWLEIIDRVALPFRMATVSFFVDSCVQAAWWAQYHDSSDRVISVVIRAMSVDVLKAKDESYPPHRTGWFSRYQVAAISNELAHDLCGRFFRQIEFSLTSDLQIGFVRSPLEFYCELFSRLVVRVEDSFAVLNWGRRIVEIHSSSVLRNSPRIWEVFASTLGRCVEALPHDLQLQLLRDIAGLPLAPPSDPNGVHKHSWIRPFELLRGWRNLSEEAAVDPVWRSLVAKAMSDLAVPKADRSVERWVRVIWLESIGVLTNDDKVALGQLIWSEEEGWPQIPEFDFGIAFHFPLAVPPTVRDERFVCWLRSLDASFAAGRSFGVVNLLRTGRSWTVPMDDIFGRAWLVGAKRGLLSSDDIVYFANILTEWWAKEGKHIYTDAPQVNGLMAALATRSDLVDQVIAASIVQSAKHPDRLNIRIIRSAILPISELLLVSGMPLYRVAILTEESTNKPSFELLRRWFAGAFLSDDDSEVVRASKLIHWMIEEKKLSSESQFPVLLAIIVSTLHARRMPSLPWALGIMTAIVRRSPEVLNDEQLSNVEVALFLLCEEIHYHGRREGSGIADDAIPVLRFRCAELASALSDANLLVDASKKVIDEAATDPLPELRFGRYRWDGKNS